MIYDDYEDDDDDGVFSLVIDDWSLMMIHEEHTKDVDMMMAIISNDYIETW